MEKYKNKIIRNLELYKIFIKLNNKNKLKLFFYYKRL